jgi:hypothetical protein
MFLATAVLPVGFTRKGKPVYPIRGAEDPPTTLEDALRRMDSLRSDLVRERGRRESAEQREQQAKTDLDSRTRERDEARQQAAAGSGDVDRRIAEARTQGEQAGKQAADAEWSPKLVQQTASLVRMQARQIAVDHGVKPEKEPPKDAPDRVGRFLALVDLAGVTDNDGAINSEQLAERVKNAAMANPEFVTASGGAPAGGGYQAAGGSGQGAGAASGDVTFQNKVDSALANMHRTLHLPAPQSNGAGT